MGGNALQVKTQRLSAEKYHELVPQIVGAIREIFSARAEVIPSFRTKDSFGDLDIIVEKEKVVLTPEQAEEAKVESIYHQLQEVVSSIFNAREISINGGVLSFDFRESETDEVGFQVDLILTPAEIMDASLNYFSYNDLGNLIGRVAHKMGLTFGHEGLLYPIRSGTHMIGRVLLTRDIDDSLSFLGFDPNRFHQGFETTDEIFNYVHTSKYFNPGLYLLENLNHASRTRDKKRKNYNGFLEYIQVNHREDVFVYPLDKEEWVPMILERYPHASLEIREMKERADKLAKVHKILAGENLTQWTGLVKKDLGVVAKTLREKMGSTLDERIVFIDNTDLETIKQMAQSIGDNVKKEKEKKMSLKP